MALTQELQSLADLRAKNPHLAKLGDADFADLIERRYPGTFPEYTQAGTIQKLAGKTENALQSLGSIFAQPAKEATQAVAGETVGRGVEQGVMGLIGNAPEMAANLLAQRYLGPAGKLLTLLGTGGSQYARQRASGDTQGQALVSAGAQLASIPATLAGARVGRKMLGTPGAVVGATLGGAATDVGEVAINYPERLSDPATYIGIGIQNAPGVGLDIADERARLAQERIKEVRKQIPALDQAAANTDAERLAAMNQTPAAMRTEQFEQERLRIVKRLNDLEVQRLAQLEARKAQDLYTTPEPPATLAAQLRMLANKKRKAVLVPKGTLFDPQPQLLKPYFRTTETPEGRLYYDPTQITEDAVKATVQAGRMGDLLGYGVPDRPEKPTGVVVLRSRKGVEKAAVAVDAATRETVWQRLNELKDEDDYVGFERPEKVIAWRKEKNGLVQNHSVRDYQGEGQDVWIAPEGTTMDTARALFARMHGPNIDMDRALQPITLDNGRIGVANPPAHFQPRLKGFQWAQRQPQQTEFMFSVAPGWTTSLFENLAKSVKPKIQGYGAKFTLDAKGNVGSAGLRQAMTKWAPPDMMEHYKSAGIDKVLGSDKVNFETFSKWVRDNTPEVEVKELIPAGSGTSDFAQIYHQIETLGYGLVIDDDGVFLAKDGKDYRIDDPEVPENVRQLAYRANHTKEIAATSDAATGRYGVEPKTVAEMDRPVDILGRVPMQRQEGGAEVVPNPEVPGAFSVRQKDGSVTGYFKTEEDALAGIKMQEGRQMFKDDHFGDSGQNTFGHVRGYFDGDTFIIYELQGTVEQKIQKLMRDRGISRNEAVQELGYSDSPLLRSYEHIMLKTAIRHALENGATKIAIVDPETAMITEQHDRQTTQRTAKPFQVVPIAGNWHVVTEQGSDLGRFKTEAEARKFAQSEFEKYPATLPQEGGMRQHYGANLPNILRKLTHEKGTPANFGKFTTREASSYFGGKDDITGKVFDLSKVDQDELRRLFSIYDLAEQDSFEKRLAKVHSALNKALETSEVKTTSEFLDDLLAGKNVETGILKKFIASIAPDQKLVRSFNLAPIHDILIQGTQSGKLVGLNKAAGLEGAFHTLAHEFSHVSTDELRSNNPEAFNSIDQFVKSHSPESRKLFLQELASALGVKLDKGVELDYLSGSKFDKDDIKNTYEFVAGVSEILSRKVMKDAGISPKIAQYLSWLPAGMQHWLTTWVRKLKQFVGAGYPSVQHMLSRDAAKRLDGIVESISKNVLHMEAANAKALSIMKRIDKFDPSQFVDNIPFFDGPESSQVFSSVTGSDELRNHSLRWLKESSLVKAIDKGYQDYFLSPLLRTRLFPFTKEIFATNHHLRGRIRRRDETSMSQLGQNADGSLSREQALANYMEVEKMLTKNFSGQASEQLNGISRVLEKDQEIISQVADLGGITQPEQLVSKADMMSKYGLNEKSAQFVVNARKMMRSLAEQKVLDMEQVDTFNVSRLFYIMNKTQDINAVSEKVGNLNRRATDLGVTRFRKEFYENALHRLEAYPNPDESVKASIEDVKMALEQENQREAAFKAVVEQEIRTMFGQDITFDPNLGKDPFINQVSELVTRLAAIRAKTKSIMQHAGYAPMTRRGRFLLRVNKTIEGEPIPGSTKEFRGFDTQKAAEDYVKSKGLPEGYYEIIDKNQIKDRAKMYYPTQLRSVRDKAREEFRALTEQLRNELRAANDPNLEAKLAVLRDMESEFRPLEQEVKEVITAKGDKFAERRWDVPGFDRNDFVPNIMEYMNYQNVVGEKAVSRAKVRYELSRPEFDKDPELAQRIENETNYVHNQSAEAAGVRNFIFTQYLGFSIRHMVQNAAQIPLVGISQMVADGAKGFEPYKNFASAAKLAAQWTMQGTTGDKNLDILLKQAESDGLTIPTALEIFKPEMNEIERGAERASKFMAGKRTVGEDIKSEASKFVAGLGKFMRSTAAASETANRRISFIAGVLHARNKKIGDLKQQFKDASWFTDYVNFVGDKSNRPGYLSKVGEKGYVHAPLLIATAMQSFVLNQLSQLYTFAKLGFGKGGSKADRSAFYTGIGALAALGGAMGLPFAETADELLEETTGLSFRKAVRDGLVKGPGETLGLDEETGNRIADAILSGLPGAVGIDTSGSLGLGSPMFRFQAGREPTALDLMGPGGGLLERYSTAAQVAGQTLASTNPWNWEEWQRALKIASPQALTYWLKMADAMDKNTVVNRQGQPLVGGLDTGDTAALALGFQPTSVTRRRKVDSALYRADQAESERYQDTVSRIAQAMYQFQQTGDASQIQFAREEFDRYVKSQAGAQDRGSFVNSIANELQKFKGPVRTPATLKGQKAVDDLASVYGAGEFRYPSQLSVAQDALRSAQLLGQSDVALQKLRTLASTLPQKALYDQLVQGGLPPAIASLVSQRGTQAARRRMEYQTQQGSSR